MPEPLVLVNPLGSDSFVLIEPAVLEDINPFRQRLLDLPESGGIFTGYRRGAHLHVCALTSPLPGDRRSRTSFHRMDHGHQAIANARWKGSSQRSDYLGEWHTHPEETPRPSGVDMREWKLILQRSAEPMVFIIAGITGEWIGVGSKDRGILQARPIA